MRSLSVLATALLFFLAAVPVAAQEGTPGPYEATVRLTVYGDPEPDDTFTLQYSGPAEALGIVRLCGPLQLEGEQDALAERCENGGTYAATVQAPGGGFDTINYSFLRLSENEFGERQTELFGSSDGLVPTGRLYSETYRYPGTTDNRPTPTISGSPEPSMPSPSIVPEATAALPAVPATGAGRPHPATWIAPLALVLSVLAIGSYAVLRLR